MPDDWDSLPQKDRDALVATKVMGWHGDGFVWLLPDDDHIPKAVYRPTENIAQAWEVQERIVALGLGVETEWAVQLAAILDPERKHDYGFDMTRRAGLATADQRCHAAVLAVEERTDE